jgi:hypothetical protein
MNNRPPMVIPETALICLMAPEQSICETMGQVQRWDLLQHCANEIWDQIDMHFDHHYNGRKTANIYLFFSTEEIEELTRYLGVIPEVKMKTRSRRPVRKTPIPVWIFSIDTIAQWLLLTAFYGGEAKRSRYYERKVGQRDREIEKPQPMACSEDVNAMFARLADQVEKATDTAELISSRVKEKILINEPFPNTKRRRKIVFKFTPNLTRKGKGAAYFLRLFSSEYLDLF